MPKLTKDEQAALDLHNKVRAAAPPSPDAHPPITWCSRLQAQAATYAAVMSKTGVMKHDTAFINAKGYGENIFMSSYDRNGPVAGPMTMATKYWTDEKQYYNGRVLSPTNMGTPGKTGQIGHYTEIVWPEVTKVGIAIVVTSKATWVVARYDCAQTTGYSAWRHVDPKLRDMFDNKIRARGDIVGPGTVVGTHLTRDARKKDEGDAVEAINKVRKTAKGSRASLYWSATLADKAFKWSQKMAKSGELEFDERVEKSREGMVVVHNPNVHAASPLTAAVEAWLKTGKGYQGEAVMGNIYEKHHDYLTLIWPEAIKVGIWAWRAEGSKYKVQGCFVVAYLDKGVVDGKSAWRSAKGLDGHSNIKGESSSKKSMAKIVSGDGTGTSVDLDKWGKNLPDSIKNIGKTGVHSPVVKNHADWHGHPKKKHIYTK